MARGYIRSLAPARARKLARCLTAERARIAARAVRATLARPTFGGASAHARARARARARAAAVATEGLVDQLAKGIHPCVNVPGLPAAAIGATARHHAHHPPARIERGTAGIAAATQNPHFE